MLHLRLLGTAGLVAATVARAVTVCGDGVLDAGETCDGVASAACPGSCVPPDAAGACSCASPPLDVRRYVLVANSVLRLGPGTDVFSGHVLASEVAGLLVVGKKSFLPAISQAAADRSRLLAEARVGRLFTNLGALAPSATIASGGPFPLTMLPVPLLDDLPPFPMPAPGTQPFVVPTASVRVLPPGQYGALALETGATLHLRGVSPGNGAGLYDLRSLTVGYGGRVVADNPVVANVAERVRLSAETHLGPADAALFVAGDIEINVAGTGVGLGRASSVTAHIRAPQARIRVGRGALFTGQLIGERISTVHATLTLQGGCGDGLLDPSEQCDPSAPVGDAACPGDCIPGDPDGNGRAAAGRPGQCSCRCTGDADCTDDDACNGLETCAEAHCVVGLPPDCNDDNPCTRDCDPALGCVNVPIDGKACSDRNPCTKGDTCAGGACTSGPAVPDGTSCSDGDGCTVTDTCQAGMCDPGPARDCSDDSTCTVDSCDAIAGCRHRALPDGDSCDDRNACTVLDRCLAGACIPGGQRNCDDANPCTADTCDPVQSCGHTPLANGTGCGNGKSCNAGVCT